MSVKQLSSLKSTWMLAALLGGGMLAGCGEATDIQVTSRYGPEIKFSGLGSTFAWASSAPADQPSPPAGSAPFHQLVRATVEKELTAKGFTLKPSGAADFLIDYQTVMREKTDTGVNPHGEVVEEGSLILDVIDPQTRNLIWRGVAQARILWDIPPDVREKRLHLAVHRLMQDFPPK